MGLYKRPDGKFVTLPDKQSQAAVERGYEPATEEQFKASKQTLRAGLEGAARGLTLGFGEPAIREFQKAQFEAGGAKPEDAEEAARQAVKSRKEENPVTSGVSEFAGMAAPALLAPEASIPKLVGGGLRGIVVEGGLMGLGQLVSESSLDNTPLDAEKAAVGIGLGALTAGATGKAFEKVGQGFSWGVKKLGGTTLQDFLRAHADDIEAKALGVQDHQYRDEILKLGRDNGIIGPSAGLNKTTGDKARLLAEEFRGKIGESMERMEKMLPLSGNPQMASDLASAVERDVGAKFGKSFAHGEALNWAQKFADDIRSTDRTWPELWKAQSDLWKEGVPSSAKREVQEAVRQSVRNFVFDEAGLGGQKAFSLPGRILGLRQLGRDSAAAQALADTIEGRAAALTKEGNILSRPVEAGVFGLLAGGPGAGLGAAASAAVGEQARKRGGFLLGSVMRGVADSQVMQGVAKKLSERVRQVLTAAPGVLGASRQVFEKALMEGEESVLNAYLREAASDPSGRVQTALGFSPESPEETEAAGHRMAALSAIRESANGVDDSIDEAVSGFLDGKAGRPVSYKSPGVKDLLGRMEAMRGVLRDPSAAYQMLPPEVTGGAPALSAQLTNQLVTAARFLDSKAPKNPYEGMPESIRPHWQPSESDVQKWYRYAEAIEQPQKVLERMSQGAFMPEHSEALKAVYPNLYADIQRRMFERLATWDKGPVPYQKKLMLAQMFGTQILGISPAQQQLMQSTFQPDVDAPASKGGTRPDGRQNIDAAKNQMTQAQRIEGRDAMNPRGQS